MRGTAIAILSAATTVFAAAILTTTSPTNAFADVKGCRDMAGKVAGSFARKRAKHLLLCTEGCEPSALEAKTDRLEQRSHRKLTQACGDVMPEDLGLPGTCPDPNGRCTFALDSSESLIECMLCMVGETLDPLLHRLYGTPADESQSCGGCSSTQCREGFYCEPPPGSCAETPEVGACVQAPEECPAFYEPVCGCDGVTYGNNCERRAAGIGIHHRGPCKTHCGAADDGDVCPDGTFCEGLPGHCDDASTVGSCEPIPEACPDVRQPVCGCDGTTYGNDCERRTAGVRILQRGACERPCFHSDPTAALPPDLGGCGPNSF